ncbi:MarR family winged helix-turn-helix transcriptional regulator [Paenibacillus tepidiphilus]|uniref:MarR family winged helix-turn-helix transcriptional regulator n=1 Tax=Paenibacillus tepidiphilus TaxID=2608683 RepID=UPI001EF021C4|nr:MarR family transcriptional regulator [Paenibacillus tepidiphilus]
MSDHNKDFIEISSMFKTFLKGISQKWNKQGFPLSLTQFKALFVICKDGPMMVSQLAAALDMTPAAITGVTDFLLAEGYVQKERASGDRRVVNITITTEGKELIKVVENKQREVLESYFRILPDEDIEHLRRIFGTLIAELDK